VFKLVGFPGWAAMCARFWVRSLALWAFVVVFRCDAEGRWCRLSVSPVRLAGRSVGMCTGAFAPVGCSGIFSLHSGGPGVDFAWAVLRPGSVSRCLLARSGIVLGLPLRGPSSVRWYYRLEGGSRAPGKRFLLSWVPHLRCRGSAVGRSSFRT